MNQDELQPRSPYARRAEHKQNMNLDKHEKSEMRYVKAFR